MVPLLQRLLPPSLPRVEGLQPWHLPLCGALHALLAHVPGGLRTPPALRLLERICYPAAVQAGALLVLGWAGAPHLWAAALHGGVCYAWGLHWRLATEPETARSTEGGWVRMCLVWDVLVTAPLMLRVASGPAIDLWEPHAVLAALAFSELFGYDPGH